MTPRLILASASPRRAKLLTEAGIVFEVKPSKVDERVPRKIAPAQAAVDIAERKAKAVKAPDSWVLAADTLIDYGGRVVGKPADEVEAHAILRMLSGTEHWVITGVAIVGPKGETKVGIAQSRVVFHEISDQQIDDYIRTGDPMDKAGAYGAQGRAKAFIKQVEGPMDNVIGLPMDTVRKLLADTGYPI
ncbi:MAG TPA: Maf family protein [Candidatus Thermoplasmatota archaeon]|nr:Maf family protein [Candidatus Thermoplasmatota archaeon]